MCHSLDYLQKLHPFMQNIDLKEDKTVFHPIINLEIIYPMIGLFYLELRIEATNHL